MVFGVGTARNAFVVAQQFKASLLDGDAWEVSKQTIHL